MKTGTLPIQDEPRRKPWGQIMEWHRKRLLACKLLIAMCLLGVFIRCAIGAESAPEWVWAESIHGDWIDYASAVTTDQEGNVFVTGTHQRMNTGPGWPFPYDTMFLRKYDSQHRMVWTTEWAHIEEGYYFRGHRVATDALGNVYLLGEYRGTWQIAGKTFWNHGNGAMLLVKFDQGGNAVWGLQCPDYCYSCNEPSPGDMKVDPAGNVYLTGTFEWRLELGDGMPLVGTWANADAFVAKIDSTGRVLWTRQIGGTMWDIDTQTGEAVAFDADGNVCVAGTSQGPIIFQGQPMPNSWVSGLYLYKLSGQGDLLWTKHIPCSASDVRACAMDLSGNSYLVGNFWDITFGNSNFFSTLPNVFVAKYDSWGELVWAKRIADTGTSGDTEVMAGSIAFDAAGNLCVAGSFGGEVPMGPTNLVSLAGLDDIFVACLEPNGSVVWATQAGGADHDAGHGVAIDPVGNIWVAGEFTGSASFGTNVCTTTNSDTDACLAELSPGFTQPVILAQPQSLTTNVGTTVLFIAGAAGTPPLSYRWQKEGVPLVDGDEISGAQNPRLVLRNLQAGAQGNYHVVVSNAVGVVTSAVAVLALNPTLLAPQIVVHPMDWHGLRGDNINFLVQTVGSEPLSYQWHWNGAPLFQATNALLTLSNLQIYQAGSYYLVASNAAGTVTSSNATLTLDWTISLGEAVDAPELSWRTSASGWTGQSLKTHDGQDAAQSFHTYDCDHSWLETTVMGPGVLSFWWKVSGNAFGDSLYLSMNGVQVASIVGEVDWQRRCFVVPEGWQRLRWTYEGCYGSGLGMGWLDEVEFRAGPPSLPNVTIQPPAQTVPEGSGAIFDVEINGPEPFTFQWRANGVDLPGATNRLLVLTNLLNRDTGLYTVLVSNPAGTVVSAPAMLNVNQPACASPSAGMVNWWPAERDGADIVGGAHASGTASYAYGIGWAFSFGGPDDRVRAPGSNMRVGTNDFSVEGWAYSHTSASWQPLVSFGLAQPTLYLRENAKLQFWPAEPSEMEVLYTAGYHHFAVVRRGSILTYYEDGLHAGSVTYQGALNPEEIIIGGDDVWGNYFFGFLDEITCYNRALSGAEVYAIYIASEGGKCREPQAPVIHQDPSDVYVWPGQDAIFRVVVTGYPAPTLQWWCYGQELPGETNATLVLRAVRPEQVWSRYYVVAKNPLGTATSDGGYLSMKSENILGEALEQPLLEWTTSGPLPWLAQHVTTWDGEDAAQSGRIIDFEQSWLETSVTGPGLLEFWWKTSSERDFDFLQFFIDEELQHAISGDTAWEQVRLEIPSGVHQLRWGYVKDESLSEGQDCGWVDQVSFTPVSAPVIVTQPQAQAVIPERPLTFHVLASGYPAPSYQWFWNGTLLVGATNTTFKISRATINEQGDYFVVASNIIGVATSEVARLTVRADLLLAEAVDAPELTWRSTFAYPNWPQSWTAQEGVTHDGTDAARSASINEDTESWLETTVTGPGLVTFWWKVSSLWYFDRLIFSIGGQVMTNISGEVDWQQETFAVPPGEQVLRWTYAVADNGWAGNNCGWLDQVMFDSNAVPVAPLISVQPRNQTVAAGSDVLFTVGVEGTRPFQYQWQWNGSDLPGCTNDYLCLTNIDASRAGTYRVLVSNTSGSVLSTGATLAVGPPLAEWQWAFAAQSEIFSYAAGTATDQDGNIYVAGGHDAQVRFGGMTITNETGQWNSFLVKFDSTGQGLWENHTSGGDATTTWASQSFAVAADLEANVIMAGIFRPDITLGTNTLSGGGIYLVKYDGLGQQLWACQAVSAGAAGDYMGRDFLTTDAAGNIFLAGDFRNEVTIGTNTFLETNFNPATFFAKYSPNGQPLWAQSIQGDWSVWPSSLAADAAGNVYLGCYAGYNVVLGTNQFGQGPFLVKFDANGQLLWGQQWQTDRYSTLKLAVDLVGNLFVAGSFAQSAMIGTNLLADTQANTVYLAKLNSDGQVQWVRQGGGSRWGPVLNLATDAAGNAYVAGEFSGIVQFDSHVLAANGQGSLFLVKYNAQGEVVWVNKAWAESAGTGHFMAADPTGNLYMSGGFNTAAYFGPITLRPASSPTAYLARLSELETLRFETGHAGICVTNGALRLGVCGIRGRSVIVETSTNLLQWQAIWTNALSADRFDFTRPLNTEPPARFYRARIAD